MSFASNLKEAMDECQMSQSQLSVLSGIGKSSISQYLSGKNIPKNPVMMKLADALDTSIDYLEGKNVSPDVSITGIALKNIPVAIAAKALGKSKQFVRVALQRSIVPFGFAVKVSGTKWSYHISPRKFNEYIGLIDSH